MAQPRDPQLRLFARFRAEVLAAIAGLRRGPDSYYIADP